MAKKEDEKKTPQQEPKNQGSGDEKDSRRRPKIDRTYFVEMAKQPNARVILADTADTFILSGLTVQANRCIMRARSQVMRNLTLDEFGDLIGDFWEKVLALEGSIVALSTATKTRYVRERGLAEIEKQLNGGIPPESDKKNPVAKAS